MGSPPPPLAGSLKESAHRYEEQQDWAGYAMVQNNLGVTYQLLAQRSVESEKNLRLATQADEVLSTG
jgi:hypothetical protein